MVQLERAGQDPFIIVYIILKGGVLVKLELIAPATQENLRKHRKAICPPLSLAMVAALTPPEVEVSLTDENVTVVDFQKETDLVGITALTITAQRAYEIADIFKARGVKVILGGSHPSALPEEASLMIFFSEPSRTWSSGFRTVVKGPLSVWP